MRFEFSLENSLPPLAWCAHVCQDRVLVRHGLAVETCEVGFFAGAWNGEFGGLDPTNSHTTIGTSCVLKNGRPLFVTPTSQTDGIYSSRRRNTLYLSNSAVFLLCTVGDEPESRYPDYYFDFLKSLRNGRRQTDTYLPSSSGSGFIFHQWENLLIRPDLKIQVVRKPDPPPPNDFDSYKNLLLDTMAAVMANANSYERRHRYRPLASLSGGYDCNTVASLASRLGCTEGLTFFQETEGVRVDSGLEVARHLGIDCREYDARAYKNLPGTPEAEFSATAVKPTCVSMLAASEQLTGSLHFTGRPGYEQWAFPDGLSDFHDLVVPSAGNNGEIGLTEFRLRKQFLHLPVPYIGATHQRALQRISVSPEMRRWWGEGSYRAPIARRILIESGVPENLFGCKKFASLAAQKLTENSHRSFEEFYRNQPVPPWFRSEPRIHPSDLTDLFGSLIFQLSLTRSPTGTRPFYNLLAPWCLRFKRSSARIFDRPSSYFKWSWRYLYLYHWGFNQIRHRYRAAM